MDLQGGRAQLWTSGNCGPVQAGLALPTLCPRVKEEVYFSDRHKGTVWPKPCNSECGLWTSSTGIPGNLLEMQNPRPHPRPPESEPAFQQDP